MPNCAFCGADLPNNARFCSNCGEVPRAIAEQPLNIRVSPLLGIPQAGAPSTLSTMASSQTPPSVGNQAPTINETQIPPSLQSPRTLPPLVGPRPQNRRPNWLGNLPLRWAIIGLVVIIVVAVGLGILTAAVRQHNVSTSTTHTNSVCPNQQSANCQPQQNSKTPVARTSTVNLLFSGAVTGRLTSPRITSCGASGSNYNLNVQGKVGGTQYALVFSITAYKGTAIYNTSQMLSGLTQQPVSLTANWGNRGNSPATATINSNIKSGTMDITLVSAFSTVHITGNWTCA